MASRLGAKLHQKWRKMQQKSPTNTPTSSLNFSLYSTFSIKTSRTFVAVLRLLRGSRKMSQVPLYSYQCPKATGSKSSLHLGKML